MTESPFHCGFVALVGRPNVGKSTLLNRILGQKIAITSPKPQTTRNRILGMHNPPGGQIVFVDTPGIHAHQDELSRRLVGTARQAAAESDVAALLIEAGHPWIEADLTALDLIETVEAPRVLIINKVDLVDKVRVLPLIEHSAQLGVFQEIVPLSALTGDNVERLAEVLIQYLPEAPAMFPGDMVTDQADRFWAGEIIREKVVRFTRDELPFSSAALVETFEETGEIIRISALVLVERESQKGIVIGKQGKMIKQIGQSARHDMEAFWGKHVFLGLQVKVSKKWWEDLETAKSLKLDPN
jgi:GTP-binding protein Era